jgi:hypothetical protein
MLEVAWSVLFLVILTGGSAVGMWLQTRLREHHKSKETAESVRMIVAMVVTFSALVLGLLVTSVKADFDDHNVIYRRYGIALIEFDQRLRQYGSEVDAIRQQLRSYTAAVFADISPDEPRPAGSYPVHLHTIPPGGDESAELTDLMIQMDQRVQGLSPADTFHQRIAAILQADIAQIEATRWTLVERSHSKLSSIFMAVLISWLLIVFVIFGVTSPRNSLTLIVIGLSAFAVASSLYLILDLDTSVGGFIKVSSRPIRDALWHMDH